MQYTVCNEYCSKCMSNNVQSFNTRAVQKTLFFSNNYEYTLICCSCSQKVTTKIFKSKFIRETPAHGHALFWLAYTGEITKNGLFSTILPFYVLGTMFLQYKW